MTGMADAEAIEAIKQVKYRYLRALDTKHWDDFADTLTEDIVGDYGSSLGEEHRFTNRKDLVEFMRKSMPAGVLTEHRVTHPEISVDGDEAEAIWYLQDRVIVPEFNFVLEGAAFYRDRYRKTPDGWKISKTGYDRTYEFTMSTEALNFKATPGKAINRTPSYVERAARRRRSVTESTTACTLDASFRDGDERAGLKPAHDLDEGVVVEGDTAGGGSTVGGVDKESAAVAGDASLVDAHHDRVGVLRDVEVLGAAGRVGVEGGSRPSCRPAWCCRSDSSCRRPTSGRG